MVYKLNNGLAIHYFKMSSFNILLLVKTENEKMEKEVWHNI